MTEGRDEVLRIADVLFGATEVADAVDAGEPRRSALVAPGLGFATLVDLADLVGPRERVDLDPDAVEAGVAQDAQEQRADAVLVGREGIREIAASR